MKFNLTGSPAELDRRIAEHEANGWRLVHREDSEQEYFELGYSKRHGCTHYVHDSGSSLARSRAVMERSVEE